MICTRSTRNLTAIPCVGQAPGPQLLLSCEHDGAHRMSACFRSDASVPVRISQSTSAASTSGEHSRPEDESFWRAPGP